MLIVPQNLSAPQTLTLIFKSPSLGADLSVATGASAAVLRSDGTTTNFALTIISATPAELVCQYTPVSGDITATGVYYLTGHIAGPGGTVLAQSIAMYVTSPNSSQPRTEESAWLAATSMVAGVAPSQRWVVVTATSNLSPFSPWVACNSTGGAMTLTLWTAQDGDSVNIIDPLGQAATHNVTLVAAAGQQVPTGVGTYGGSIVLSTAGFSLRLKYNAGLSKWLAW